MWKNYSFDSIRHNRAGSYSIVAASFIAALFLSFLCCLFYNFWLDGVQSGAGEVPAAFFLFYLTVVVLISVSLILVIHNSFAVSMQDRVHQFGIFSSVGATPGQIRTCLLQEALFLSAGPVCGGILTGVLFCFLTVRAMSGFAKNLAGGRSMDFALHPAILLGIFAISFLTVLLSALIPAWKLSVLTPLEAIKGADELRLKKKKRPGLLPLLFGIEGELAENALHAQKKALRTTTISLTFAFLGFMLMQSFFALSGVSTEHTYFERYQDIWDVYVTIEEAGLEDFGAEEGLRDLEGAESVILYQKAEAVSLIPAGDISPELRRAGGPEAISGLLPVGEEKVYQIGSPLVILDDKSFADYCVQIGIRPGAEGIIAYNRIWDSQNSNFRHPEYLPYLKENVDRIVLQSPTGSAAEEAFPGDTVDAEQEALQGIGGTNPDLLQEDAEEGDVSGMELPLLACSETPPLLREEYRDYALVLFMPFSFWENLSGQVAEERGGLSVCILAKDRESPVALERLEEDAAGIFAGRYRTESENRIQEKRDNDRMIWGYKVILSGLCILFAQIGIANLFSNTLGFLSKRKREFARYLSVGVTPEGIRRLLAMEAAALVGRPLFLTIILWAAASAYLTKLSGIDPMEFIRALPAGQILTFVLTILGFAALSYYFGGRKIVRLEPVEALRDDTML